MEKTEEGAEGGLLSQRKHLLQNELAVCKKEREILRVWKRSSEKLLDALKLAKINVNNNINRRLCYFTQVIRKKKRHIGVRSPRHVESAVSSLVCIGKWLRKKEDRCYVANVKNGISPLSENVFSLSRHSASLISLPIGVGDQKEKVINDQKRKQGNRLKLL